MLFTCTHSAEPAESFVCSLYFCWAGAFWQNVWSRAEGSGSTGVPEWLFYQERMTCVGKCPLCLSLELPAMPPCPVSSVATILAYRAAICPDGRQQAFRPTYARSLCQWSAAPLSVSEMHLFVHLTNKWKAKGKPWTSVVLKTIAVLEMQKSDWLLLVNYFLTNYFSPMDACFKCLGNKTLLLLINGFQRRFYPVTGRHSHSNRDVNMAEGCFHLMHQNASEFPFATSFDNCKVHACHLLRLIVEFYTLASASLTTYFQTVIVDLQKQTEKIFCDIDTLVWSHSQVRNDLHDNIILIISSTYKRPQQIWTNSVKICTNIAKIVLLRLESFRLNDFLKSGDHEHQPPWRCGPSRHCSHLQPLLVCGSPFFTFVQ